MITGRSCSNRSEKPSVYQNTLHKSIRHSTIKRFEHNSVEGQTKGSLSYIGTGISYGSLCLLLTAPL